MIETPPIWNGKNQRYNGLSDIRSLFGLSLIDAIVGYLVLGAALTSAGFEFISHPERERPIDWTVPAVTLCVMSVICWLSAWPLFRKRLYISGAFQIILGSGLLALLALAAVARA